MSLHFYAFGEDKEKEESINNYKDLFIPYIDNPPTIEDALRQIFISGGVPEKEVDEYIIDIIKKVNKLLENKERASKIKEKYPNITHEDSVIISTYTREALNSEYSPYKILNRNLASDNREEGLKKVSKYLYILLKTLRKLKKYYPDEEQKYLYRGIKIKVETKIDPYKPKFVPYIRNKIKTFWAFTSTSWLTSTACDFLGDNGYNEEKKLKSGTFFSLYGKIFGYDISLFNTYNEEEILLEPERKFRIENVVPEPNDIVNVTCEILDSPIVLDNLKKISILKQMPFHNNDNLVSMYEIDAEKKEQEKQENKLYHDLTLLIINLQTFISTRFGIKLGHKESVIKCIRPNLKGKFEEEANYLIDFLNKFKNEIGDNYEYFFNIYNNNVEKTIVKIYEILEQINNLVKNKKLTIIIEKLHYLLLVKKMEYS